MVLTPEQWNEVKELFAAALEQPASERSSFLRRAGSEETVVREVERLLSHHTEGPDFAFDPLAHLAAATRTKQEQPTFSAGEILASRFRVIRFLARGGMGEVYEAEDLELHEEVALKTIRPEILSDPHSLERFKREVHLAKKVTHPNICRIFDLFRHATSADASVALVSMELLRGETLAAHLDHVDKMSCEETEPIALQMANGLAAAHEMGILHRDFKPTNVVLIHSTKKTRVVITDFGLALQHGEDVRRSAELTTGGQMGTPAYMSPEQVEGKTLTPASDVYSLGLVLYEMVTGRLPFDEATPLSMAVRRLQQSPPPPRTIVPDLEEKWNELIACCIERLPEKRFTTAEEVAKAIKDDTWHSFAKARGRRIMAFSLCAVFLILGVAGALYYRWRNTRLTDKDTIVLADFTNTTGDPLFDDTLKTALGVSLRQSPFLSVVSDGKVASTLKLMTLPRQTRLTPDVARDICQRAGSKAYVGGSIAAAGDQYLVGLTAVNCRNGDTLAQESATAESKQRVVDALGQAASRLRQKLGESLTTVQKFDVSLSEATTSSLDALKALSLGRQALLEKGEAAALPYHQRAIELDPGFAIGYRSVGADYYGLGEIGRAREYYSKAFQLRERAGERERLYIEMSYYGTVTGELDKALATDLELTRIYSRDPAYTSIGNIYSQQGQYENATEAYRLSLGFTPDSSIPYGNLVISLLALERFDDAEQIIQQAEARNLLDFQLHETVYALAFLRGDASGMAAEQHWFEGKPEENNGLSLASDTEAYAGHLAKARELTKSAVDSAIRDDSKETGSTWLENSALREAAFGEPAAARQLAADGLKLAPASSGNSAETALAFAMSDDAARAEALADDLNKTFPLDTQMQSLWLPAIHAQLALNRKNPAEAIRDLQVTLPIEYGLIIFLANVSCLYPTYIRGEAYLAEGESAAASAEFRKIIDHSGVVWNCWTGALARLGLARANALQAKNSQGADADAARVRAVTAYKDFLTLWKDADPNIPVLKQAKAEYARLK